MARTPPTSVSSDSPWMKLNGPNMRTSVMANELSATTAIVPTQTRPSALWRDVPLRMSKTTVPRSAAQSALSA